VTIINDPRSSSQCSKLPSSDVVHATGWNLSELLEKTEKIHWETTRGRNGKVSRRSAWYTMKDCSCSYSYGHGQPWTPNDFEDWMLQFCRDAAKLCKLNKVPNAINFNEYSSTSQALGFHADDEELFPDENGESSIVSFSLGSMREFKIKKYYDPDNIYVPTLLRNGDVLIMRGAMQKHFQHAIAQGTSDCGGKRVNFTLRHVCNHNSKCLAKDDY
jgi:alkylated DNA repair dioxygenase AlkB